MDNFYASFKRKLVMTCMAALCVILAVVHIATHTMIKNIVSEQSGQSAQNIAVVIDAATMFSKLVRLQYSMLAVYALIMAVCFVLLNRYLLNPAVKDTLTGAGHQRYDEPLMRREVQNAVKNGEELAFLLLAPDHFKTVKDICGHSFSDTVMAAVSKTVMRYLQPSDRFFRFGDEVVGVAIPNVEIQSVLQFAEGIRKTVANTGIFNDDLKRSIKVTVSIGVAHLSGAKLSGVELVGNANKALDAAQKKHNTVLLFRPDYLNTEAGTLTAEDCDRLLVAANHIH